jgi:hypothetical protein
MWQEVISYEEAQEYKVIHNPFKVKKILRDFKIFELQKEILSYNWDLAKLELLASALLISTSFCDLWLFALSTASAASCLVLVVVLSLYRLSQNVEMWLMCAETQHDKIGICSINAVRCVHIVVFLSSLRSDEVQDLVLSFSGYESIREDDLEVLPSRVAVKTLHDIQLESS